MRKAFGFFFLGLITAMAGVGGVETSLTNTALIQSVVVAFLGILIMYVGIILVGRETQ